MGLFDFLNKLPIVNEMTGSFGEWLAKNYAKVTTDALVLHDVLIDGENGYTSQIDMILVGTKGLYVVEVKMYADAKVYGDGNKSKWYYYNHGKKYEIYSPVKQNQKHIKYLKEFLKEFGDVPCFSIVTVICDDFKVSNINRTEEINTVVCGSLPAMNDGIMKIAKDKPVVYDEAKKKEIFDFIQDNQRTGNDARKQHKEEVKTYKDNLEEMEQQKICPYCKVPLVKRNGKFGEFYGCPNYPKCRYTMK